MNTATTCTAIILSLLLASCAPAQDIEIGVLVILTGPGATWGQSSMNGAQLAAEELNREGGVLGREIKLIAEDTKASPRTALSGYRKLRDASDVHYIIGTSWTTEALPLIPIAREDEVVMISPSLGVADFNEGADNLFNLWPHDAILSERMAELVYAEGHRKVGILGAKDEWVEAQTIAFAQRFEELGGEVVIESPAVEDKSQMTQATRIAHEEVDAIMFTNTITGDIAAKRLRELGVDKPMFSITMGADTIAASDGAMEGLRFLTSLTPSAEFREKYAERFPGQVLDVGGDTAYDAVMLLAQAMRETGSTDPAAVEEYLNSIETYEGASGSLLFDGDGGVTKEFVLFVVRDAKASPVE